MAGRVPPHDLDAEAAVLSAIFLDRSALDRALEILKPEHFYSEANARIFQAAQQLAASLTPIDTVSIASWLRDREWLQKIGGAAYLAQLVDATPAVGHVGAHAAMVREKWRIRQIIATCQRVAAEGYGDIGEPQLFLDGAKEAIAAIASAPSQSRVITTNDVADLAMAQITEAITGRTTGTRWGWTPVDDRVGLLVPQGYYVIPARSGHGKTQFMMQTALNIAEGPSQDGYANIVYLACFEMPSVVLFKRTTCIEADVSYKRAIAGDVYHVRRFEHDGAACPACGATYRPSTYAEMPMSGSGKLCMDCKEVLVEGPSEQERLKSTAARLRRTQIIWDDRRCPPDELARRVSAAQELAEQGKLVGLDGRPRPKGRVRAVMIDYIQKMPAPPGAYNRSRQVEVAATSNGIVENVAKGCKVAVVALAQLNRAVDKQKEARPTLADIREAGDIENDADEILAIHREQYRLKHNTPPQFQNIAEWIHLKGRGGLDLELPPARAWFVRGKFYATSPDDDRLCDRHAHAYSQAAPGEEMGQVIMEAQRCSTCYDVSWRTWAARVGADVE